MAHTAPPVSGNSWITTGSMYDQAIDLQSGAPEMLDWHLLRGHVVVVVFWSLGCEASLLQLRSVQQLLTDLNALAERSDLDDSSAFACDPGSTDYPESLLNSDPPNRNLPSLPEVVAIAVHTPRFPYEDDEKRLRNTIDREQLKVPVVHDPEFSTWNRYNPGGWPATAVIGKDQSVQGLQIGTDGNNQLGAAVRLAMAAPAPRPTHGLKNLFTTRTRTALPNQSFISLGKTGRNSGKPYAPSAPPGRHQAATDNAIDGETFAARRHDVVVSRAAPGEPLSSQPATVAKRLFGPTSVAAHPCGMVAIADTGNNRVLIGSVDHDLRKFTTRLEIANIASPTGMALANPSELYVIERSTASVIRVNLDTGDTNTVARDFVAPTSLCLDQDGSIVVTDAGAEQLFRIVLARQGEVLVGPIAGSGATGFDDGPAAKAALAQPVAVARSENGLVFCDAASSNIRLLSDDGIVSSATNNDLFQWGLVDGPIHQAKLQRPSGLAVLDDGSIIIADTGNDRLRVLKNQRLTTLGVAELNTPTGLAPLSPSMVLVADTGNNRVLVVSPAEKQAWTINLNAARRTGSHREVNPKTVSVS